MILNCLESNVWEIFEIDGTGNTLFDICSKHNIDPGGIFAVFKMACETKVGPTNLPKNLSHHFDRKNSTYQFIKNRLRVVYFLDDNKLIICTHCILKKNQEVTKQDKKTALRFKNNYLKCKSNGQVEFIPLDKVGE